MRGSQKQQDIRGQPHHAPLPTVVGLRSPTQARVVCDREVTCCNKILLTTRSENLLIRSRGNCVCAAGESTRLGMPSLAGPARAEGQSRTDPKSNHQFCFPTADRRAGCCVRQAEGPLSCVRFTRNELLSRGRSNERSCRGMHVCAVRFSEGFAKRSGRRKPPSSWRPWSAAPFAPQHTRFRASEILRPGLFPSSST